jgi:sigma-B regulation protein RsbU (phosphoserine phosphatase)
MTTTPSLHHPSVATTLRFELQERRARLEAAMRSTGGHGEASQLLAEVDAALARLDVEGPGRCAICEGPIGPERLLVDPLTTVCTAHVDAGERRALDRDLELAGRIQRRLLPPASTSAFGWRSAYRYRPAGQVSGDYCDVVKTDADSLFFVTADISGKGVAASLLMSHLHAIVHTLLASGGTPAALLRQANRFFCESILSSHFATAVFGRAREDGTVTIANAGHWPALVVRRDGVEPLEATGVPLGFTCAAGYGEHVVHLAPGDALVLHTDGVTEAHTETDEDYGRDRLTDVLRTLHGAAPDEIAGGVLADLGAFLGTAPLADDLTILVLSREA